MAKNRKLIIPIICENPKCSNFNHLVNEVTGLTNNDLDLFYEGYNGSDEQDYCPICQKLGIAEDYFIEQDSK